MYTLTELFYFCLASLLFPDISESLSGPRGRELIFKKTLREDASEISKFGNFFDEDKFKLETNASWEILQNKTKESDWKNTLTQTKLYSLFSELIYLIETESDDNSVPIGLIESIVIYECNEFKNGNDNLSLKKLHDLLNNSLKEIQEIPAYTEGHVELNNLHKLLNILNNLPKNIVRDSLKFTDKNTQYLTLLERFKSIIKEDILEHDIPLTVIEFIFSSRQKEISPDIIEEIKYLHFQNRHKNNETEHKRDEENVEHVTNNDVENETDESPTNTSKYEVKRIMTSEISNCYSNFSLEGKWISGSFTSNPRIFDIVFGGICNKLKIFVRNLILERLQDIELFKLLLEKII